MRAATQLSGESTSDYNSFQTVAGTFTLAADHMTRANTKLTTSAYGLLSGAGASAVNDINSKLDTNVGNGAVIKAANIDIAAVNRFEQAAKMMKTVAKGGMPQIPGMGPMPGAGYGGKGKIAPKKKGSKSGNPAKRAAENAAIASGETLAGPSTGGSGSGFGLGSGNGGGSPARGAKAPPTAEELSALQKMLGRG